jgi:predicted metal-binding protein
VPSGTEVTAAPRSGATLQNDLPERHAREARARDLSVADTIALTSRNRPATVATRIGPSIDAHA